jgi:hypothetical protein
MNDMLPEVIREARRALRRASGIALTPTEQSEEHQNSKLEAMQMFVFDKFRVRGMAALTALIVWTDDGVAAKFTANGKTFFLRECEKDYSLSASEKKGERELLRLSAGDPQFSNRIFVAIGDAMDWS